MQVKAPCPIVEAPLRWLLQPSCAALVAFIKCSTTNRSLAPRNYSLHVNSTLFISSCRRLEWSSDSRALTCCNIKCISCLRSLLLLWDTHISTISILQRIFLVVSPAIGDLLYLLFAKVGMDMSHFSPTSFTSFLNRQRWPSCS